MMGLEQEGYAYHGGDDEDEDHDNDDDHDAGDNED